MRRSALLPLLLLPALAAPGGARADVLTEYTDLAHRELDPAPLVFTDVPSPFRPIDRRLEPSGPRRRTGYGLRLVNPAGDAVIAYQGGAFKGMRGALRELRRHGMRDRPTRVRGHAGRLLTGAGSRVLVWREDRRIHWLGTGTTGTVSLKAVRRAAEGLQRLGGAFAGSGGDPDLGTGATLVTTERTITAHVEWGAHCVAADGFERADRAGSLRLVLAPTDGTTFREEIAGDGWTGSVSGRISRDAVEITVRATTAADGATCDTGAVTFTARPSRPL